MRKLLFSLLVVALLVAALPTLLSTRWLNRLIVERANEAIAGELAIEALEFSWFSGQKAKGLTLSGSDGVPLLSVEELALDLSFPNLLLFRFEQLQGAAIKGLEALLVLNQKGVSTIDLALAPHQDRLDSPLPPIKLLLAHAAYSQRGAFTLKAEGSVAGAGKSGKLLVDMHLALPGRAAIASPRFFLQLEEIPLEVADLLAAAAGKESGNLFQTLLGPTVTAETSKSGNGVSSLKIASEKLSGSLVCTTEGGAIELKQPAQLSYQLTPEALTLLAPASPITLAEKATASLEIEKLRLPYGTFSLPESVEAALTCSESKWEVRSLASSFTVSSIKATLSKKAEGALQLAANASAQEPQGEGGASLSLLWSGDYKTSWEEALHSSSWQLAFNLDKLPTALLDKSLGNAALFAQLLGPRLSVKVNGESEGGGGNLMVAIQSDHLVVPHVRFKLGGALTLSSPAVVEFTLPQNAPLALGPLSLAKGAPFELRLEKINIPLEKKLGWRNGAVQASVVAMEPIALSFDGAPLFLELGELKVGGEKLSEALCDLRCTLKSESGLAAELFGRDASLQMIAQIGSGNGWEIPSIKVELESALTKLNLNARYVDGAVELMAPAHFAATLSPHLLQLFGVERAALMAQPAHVELAVAPFSTAKEEGDWKIAGALEIRELVLSPAGEQVRVEELVAPWEYERSQNKLKVSFSGKAALEAGKESGSFRGKLAFKQWPFTEEGASPQVKGAVELHRFPTALIAAVAGSDRLPGLLGDLINLSIEGETGSLASPGKITAALRGEELEASAQLLVGDKVAIDPKGTPALLTMKLNQKRLDLLRSYLSPLPYPLQLLQPAEVKLTVSSLELPRDGALPLWNSPLQAHCLIAPFVVAAGANQNPLSLDKLELQVASSSLSDESRFSLEALPSSGKDRGALVVKGSLRDLLTPEGVLNLHSLSLQCEAHLHDWSPPLFCSLFLPQYPWMVAKLEAITGPSFSVEASAQLQNMHGPLSFQLTGELGRAEIDGQLSGGRLLLNGPARLQVKGTPALGKELLKEIIPVMKGLQSSDGLITLTVDPDGFSLPVRSFALEELQIGKATLETGKMQFKRSGTFKTVMALLGAPGPEMLSLWATPLYMSLQQGKLNIQRVDLLIDKEYPVACWGTVDFIKDRVNLVIGVRPPALLAALKLATLSSDQMLQIAVKGTIDNPTIDTTKVAARISALLAQGEGKKGAVLGTVLELAGGALGDGKEPPPTTWPLPWDEGKVEEEAPSAKKKGTKASETLEKGAKNLFKKLFE